MVSAAFQIMSLGYSVAEVLSAWQKIVAERGYIVFGTMEAEYRVGQNITKDVNNVLPSGHWWYVAAITDAEDGEIQAKMFEKIFGQSFEVVQFNHYYRIQGEFTWRRKKMNQLTMN
jgi:hypothetical protein